MIKTYKDLRRLSTFEERFEYLKLGGAVGNSTFGFDRYLNQLLYHSKEWRRTRDHIIIRDEGRDLGIDGRDIHNGILVHHITPISIENIERGDDCVYDPENLICTSHNTHNAIHYGDSNLLTKFPKPRVKGDTQLW